MADGGNPSPGFTREARRRLNAIRAGAYALACIFLLTMSVQVIWVPRDHMVDDAERSVRSTEIAVSALVDATGRVDPPQVEAMLAALSAEWPTGVSFGIADRNGRPVPGLRSLAPGTTAFRRIAIGGDGIELRAAIDGDAIGRAVLRANIVAILSILALGVPALLGFLYQRRTISQPAFALLDYAQTRGDTHDSPPDVPPIWAPVLERLTQLKNSQMQFEAFLDHAPIGMSAFKPDGPYVLANRFAAEYYDSSVEELVGKVPADFIPYFPDIEKLRPLFVDPIEHGTTVTVETEFLAPSGGVRNLAITTFPVFDSEGGVSLVGTYFVDMTQQRRTETDLEQSRALFEAFIQNAPNPMALMDAKGQYVMLNNAVAHYYDMTSDALLAAGPKFIHSRFPEAQTVIAPMLGRVMSTLEGEQIDTPFKSPTGEIRDMAFAFFPILDSNGKLAFVGNISHDMTDERRAQSELAQSKDSLHQAEKLAALGSMLAGVSHELNNPLAAVIGQAALLAEDLEGTTHADRIAKIRRAADRCARIVQSFLAMARQKAPEYRSVDLNDQVRAAAELTEYQMRAANVTLDLRLEPRLPAIEADPDQLHQVIVNLLTNARQALESRAGLRRVTVTTARARDLVTLTVADNGPGIEPALRQRIFDPFFTTKDVGAGTGIGLSYSLGIVEAHGGTIAIEDSPDGTVFVVRLPVKESEPMAAHPKAEAKADARGRALVVDDEADVAETLADMLQRAGMDARVAIGGHAGRAALADGARFDLILSDVRMPDLDGPALHAWICRQRPDLAGKIAFVTGDTMSGHVADFLAKARCPVLEKPFTPASLRALVAAMTGRDEGESA